MCTVGNQPQLQRHVLPSSLPPSPPPAEPRTSAPVGEKRWAGHRTLGCVGSSRTQRQGRSLTGIFNGIHQLKEPQDLSRVTGRVNAAITHQGCQRKAGGGCEERQRDEERINNKENWDPCPFSLFDMQIKFAFLKSIEKPLHLGRPGRDKAKADPWNNCLVQPAWNCTLQRISHSCPCPQQPPF